MKEGLKENSYVWDSESFPDGYYVLKISASDEPDNPPEKAMSGEKVSEPFLTDNTSPEIKELKVSRRKNIEGSTYDATSRILQIEYSLDGEDWVNIFPEDDIFDSQGERFTFSLPPLSATEHTVVLKATDSEGNVGTGKIVF